MRRAVLGALAVLGADQLRHFGLHQLLRDRSHRLTNHVCVLIAQHLPDDLLDRHPVPTGHRRPPFVEALRTPTIMSAAVAGLRSIRPTRSYTNTRDVTRCSSDSGRQRTTRRQRRSFDRSVSQRAQCGAARIAKQQRSPRCCSSATGIARFSGSSRAARRQMLKYVITRGPTRPRGRCARSHGHLLLQPMPNTPRAARA